MEAEQILTELRKLIDREKSEGQENVDEDVSHLEDAIESIGRFIDSEEGEQEGSPAAQSNAPTMNPVQAGIIDTGVLTGPITGLRNFLVRKQQDIQGQ